MRVKIQSIMSTQINNTDNIPPARVLIVEDEAITALDLKQTLVTLGYEVVGVADNAVDAVTAMEREKPDVVLMDIRLSGDDDGILAASVIHGYTDIPVIFLTAHSDEATLKRALNASPFGYVLKPFQVRELRGCIEVALYKSRKEREIHQLVHQLTDALENVRTLSGLLSICITCKKIEVTDGSWQRMEEYIENHSEAQFSHGLCPECAETVSPGMHAGA